MPYNRTGRFPYGWRPGSCWLLDRIADPPCTRSELHAIERPDQIEVRNDDHLREILDWLRADHYLDAPVADGERRYQWRYPALCRIWVLRRL